MRPTLVIMLKEPRPGRVKTRLGRDMGLTRSAWWFRHQSTRLIQRLGRDPRWHTVLAVSPDAEGLVSRVWPSDLPRWPQGPGDLGARMARAVRGLGPGPVIIIGADIPGIRPRHIAQAARAVAREGAALGPAPDGGYWLIGWRGRIPKGFLKNVRWSTEHSRADTQATMDRPPALLETLGDIDTLADLKAFNRGI